MGVIDPKLLEFRNSVSPEIGSMNTMCDTIQNKMGDIGKAATTARNTLENSYSSSNLNTILSKFDKLSDIYSRINTSIGGDMKNIISQAEALIKQIEELESINKDIESRNQIIAERTGNTDSSSISIVTIAKNEINNLNSIFIQKHESATKKLEALKTLDSSFQFTNDFSPNNTVADPSDLQYGTYELRTFRSSNGTEIEYYVYIPDYGKEVKNLPAMLYMHGSISSPSNQNWHKYGLTGLIENKTLTPSGIVVMPHIANHKDLTTLKELMDYIVEEYDCDTDRISVSGHSSGAIASYNLINQYPGYFSCAIPISGCNFNSITEQAVEGTRIWAFVGANENENPYESTWKDTCVNAINRVKKLGGDGTITVMPGGHSNTNLNTYANMYMSPDGEEVNVLDWAFEQTRS